MPRSLIILLFCIALIGTNGMILSPVLTDIAAHFEISPSTAGRAIAGYGIGTAFTAVWLGRSLDGFGVERALLLALMTAGAGEIGSAFATGPGMLIGFQVLSGMGAGVALPAIYGITGAISPKGKESRYMARVLLGWSVSLVGAVPLGALLSDMVGWRAMLGIIGVLCFLLVPLVPTLPAVTTHARTTPKMPRFAPLFLPGGAVMYLTCLLFMTSFYGVYAYIGDHARQAFTLSSSAAGLIALIYGAGFGIAAFAAPWIDRLGRKTALRLGLILAAMLLTSMSAPGSFALLLPLIFAWGWVNHFILNMIVTGLNGLAPDHRGAVLGLYSGTTYFGAFIGAIFMGYQYNNFGFTGLTLTAAALYGAALILVFIRKA